MKTPFTTEQFLAVFEHYNSSVFPVQLLIVAMGLFAMYWLIRKKPFSKFITAIFLSFVWLWAGVVYHIGFLACLNKPAYVFGALFSLQALLILYESFVARKLIFKYESRLREYTGIFLVIFGLIIYPLISWAMKGSYDLIIAAGLPCPSVIATFGFLALTEGKVRNYLYIIPILWSIVGISAALNFGIYQDFMMLLSGITVIVLNRKSSKMKVQVPVTSHQSQATN